MKHLIILFASLFGGSLAKAQMIEVPLNYNKSLAKASKSLIEHPTAARVTTLTLPFLDDFSYNGSYPTPELWEANNQAWVNRGMGKKPPTVGVATLDGLQANGQPYRWTTITGASLDTMTSLPINLSTFSGIDSIYLSFYYQPGGNGDMPEASDKMLVDFKDNTGAWVNQRSFSGQSGSVPNFKGTSIVLSAAVFLHSDFQFRFRNIGNARGARDHWHIDYVKIAKNRRWDEPFFNDVAFFAPPPSPFLNYTAMPYRDFVAGQPADIWSPMVEFSIWNHFNTPYSPDLSVVVDELYSNTTLLPQQTPFFQPIPQGKDSIILKSIALSNYNLAALPPSDSGLIRVRNLFTNVTGQDNLVNQSNFALSNDTVTRFLPLRDYFAYDDGSAESALITQSIGTRAAVKFRALAGDTLQGVRLHVPAYDFDVQSQLFDFEVYLNDLNGSPVFTQPNLHPYYGDSLQYWTSYPFFDNNNRLPPYIPANTDFYIVWKQASTAHPVPIGFDRNTPSNAQFLYQNTGNGWTALSSSVQGALMMRPYMGNKRFVNTAGLVREKGRFTLYPNPTQSNIFIQNNVQTNTETFNYELINALGQSMETGILRNSLSVEHLPKGVYFLRLSANNGSHFYETLRFIKE